MLQAFTRVLGPAERGRRHVVSGTAASGSRHGLHTGFRTPLAGTFSALAGIAVHVWHPSVDPSIVSLLSSNTIAIATAIALLGPGALSLDACFFGRRKIIIPRVPDSLRLLSFCRVHSFVFPLGSSSVDRVPPIPKSGIQYLPCGGTKETSLSPDAPFFLKPHSTCIEHKVSWTVKKLDFRRRKCRSLE